MDACVGDCLHLGHHKPPGMGRQRPRCKAEAHLSFPGDMGHVLEAPAIRVSGQALSGHWSVVRATGRLHVDLPLTGSWRERVESCLSLKVLCVHASPALLCTQCWLTAAVHAVQRQGCGPPATWCSACRRVARVSLLSQALLRRAGALLLSDSFGSRCHLLAALC